MSFEVTLFGELAVTVARQTVQFSTKPAESLFAYLITQKGKPTSRVALAEAIWPEVEQERATNRLRTTLVHLKKALLPWTPIAADRQTVSLNTANSEVDLHEAERLYRRSRIAQDPDEERAILQRLLGVANADFLADAPFPWAEPIRLHWRERRIEAALRLASIGIALEDYELAENESLRALSIEDLNEEAWSIYLRAMLEIGRQKQAKVRFDAARRKRLTDLGFDFSKDLLQLANRLQIATPKPKAERNRFSEPARNAITTALEEAHPEILLPILATDPFRKEAFKNPNDAWKLLRRVLDATEGTSPERLKVIQLLIFLTDIVGQPGVACDYAEWMIENIPEDKPQHWYAVNNLGFINFELREWDAAWTHMHRYLELAQKYDSPRDVSIAKSQMASFNWHQGKLDLALEEYRSQAEQLSKDQTVQGLLNLSALSVNTGTILTIQGKWREAKEDLAKAHSLALSNGFDYVKALTMAPLGMSLVMTGQKAEGRRLAALGLAHTYRSRYRRMHEISADYAAGALAACGYVPQGLAVIDAYTEFRAESHHARSDAEQQFADWIRQEFQTHSAPKNTVTSRPSEIVATSCDLLEDS